MKGYQRRRREEEEREKFGGGEKVEKERSNLGEDEENALIGATFHVTKGWILRRVTSYEAKESKSTEVERDVVKDVTGVAHIDHDSVGQIRLNKMFLYSELQTSSLSLIHTNIVATPWGLSHTKEMEQYNNNGILSHAHTHTFTCTHSNTRRPLAH